MTSTFLAAALAEAGIDAIEVSGGTGGSGKLGAARSKIETEADEAYFLPQAEAIRAAAPGVPIMLVGGVRSLEKMESVLAAGSRRLLLHVTAVDPRARSAQAVGRRRSTPRRVRLLQRVLRPGAEGRGDPLRAGVNRKRRCEIFPPPVVSCLIERAP